MRCYNAAMLAITFGTIRGMIVIALVVAVTAFGIIALFDSLRRR
jgi:hypothetical protein